MHVFFCSGQAVILIQGEKSKRSIEMFRQLLFFTAIAAGTTVLEGKVTLLDLYNEFGSEII